MTSYLSREMSLNYCREMGVDYERKLTLRYVEVVHGVLHPLSPSKVSPGRLVGGVLDKDGAFVEFSATKRFSPHSFKLDIFDWFDSPAEYNDVEAVQSIENAVFLGALPNHYGHFITEGLSRLWFCMDIVPSDFNFVYISECEQSRFLEFFRLFGIPEDRLVEVVCPTRFDRLLVPEPSIRLHDYFHEGYGLAIKRICENCKPVAPSKIFLSKANSTNGRGIGELPIQRIFHDNQFSILFPEEVGIEAMVSALQACSLLVGVSGSLLHNAIFLPDGSRIVCLNRSAHFHPLQTMINRMRQIDAVYVDAFLFSSIRNFGELPCFVFPTRHLLRYFSDHSFAYSGSALVTLALFEFPSFALKYLYVEYSRLLHYLDSSPRLLPRVLSSSIRGFVQGCRRISRFLRESM